jgi:hypothetical protein
MCKLGIFLALSCSKQLRKFYESHSWIDKAGHLFPCLRSNGIISRYQIAHAVYLMYRTLFVPFIRPIWVNWKNLARKVLKKLPIKQTFSLLWKLIFSINKVGSTTAILEMRTGLYNFSLLTEFCQYRLCCLLFIGPILLVRNKWIHIIVCTLGNIISGCQKYIVL